MIEKEYLLQIIERAIKEDVGDGDFSSLSCISKNASGFAECLVKQNGILAGIDIAENIFNYVSPDIKMEKFFKDGNHIKKGDIIFKVYGPKIKILEAERTVLNFLQRMCGIATETFRYVEKIRDTKAKLLDTRKTTPGLRLIEKYAVKTGGGTNHRIGLYDMIMLKDNHIDFAGGIKNAIGKANDFLKINNKNIKIEIEVRNFDELKQVLDIGKIDRIMMDNFSVPDTKKAVNIINSRYETESSGGINIDNIRDYALTGVDYISIGAITHQLKSLDLSLKVI